MTPSPTPSLDAGRTSQAGLLWAKHRALEEARERKLTKRQRASANDFRLMAVLKFVLKVSGLWSRGRRNADHPVLRELDMHLDNLPQAFDSFRILHLSDFHFRDLQSHTDAILESLQGVQADLCVMTGDYRCAHWGPYQEAVKAMEKVLGTLSARHGVVGVLGNHDPTDLVAAYRDLGIRMLVNEHIEIREGDARMWILGVDDPNLFACHSLPLAAEGIPQEEFMILLAHSPELYHEASTAGVDLYLAGHTHGGQVRLPWGGALMLNCPCPRAYAEGLWRHGTMQGYTTAGLGTTDVHVRFNCPPEAVLIRLLPNKDVARKE